MRDLIDNLWAVTGDLTYWVATHRKMHEALGSLDCDNVFPLCNQVIMHVQYAQWAHLLPHPCIWEFLYLVATQIQLLKEGQSAHEALHVGKCDAIVLKVCDCEVCALRQNFEDMRELFVSERDHADLWQTFALCQEKQVLLCDLRVLLRGWRGVVTRWRL